jgi:hypothetical protein
VFSAVNKICGYLCVFAPLWQDKSVKSVVKKGEAGQFTDRPHNPGDDRILSADLSVVALAKTEALA